MTRIPDRFWQAELPPPLPSIQLTPHISINLERSVIVRNGKLIILAPQEAKLLFLLIEKRRVSPGGILPTGYLVKEVLTKHAEMSDPEHALEEIVSKTRDKLGEKKRAPRLLVCVRGRGYKLCPDKGFGAIQP